MKKINLPHIGQRIIKSSASVLLCYIIYFLRGRSGMPFYSMLAALWCIQPYTGKTYKMAAQRITGTIVGAVFGLASILLEIYVFDIYDNFWGFFMNALFIIPVLYTTVLMHKKNASYFSCSVYLSIAVNHMADAAPYIFVMNRVLDTFIGIAAGIIVNYARLPRKKNKDCLFITILDDMISPVKEELSSYSKIELNRMIDEGMKFTIATMRTPASLIKPLEGVNLEFPVIAMDGAALYDLKENAYLTAYVISYDSCGKLTGMIRSENMNCFISALCDDTLIIFYKDLVNKAEKDIFQELKCSPYRNYVRREPSSLDRTIYIMVIDETMKINAFYQKLIDSGLDRKFKILCYTSNRYEGFSYIKIYNRNASIDNMIQHLMSASCLKSKNLIQAENDKRNNFDDIVKSLKRGYEPFIFKK